MTSLEHVRRTFQNVCISGAFCGAYLTLGWKARHVLVSSLLATCCYAFTSPKLVLDFVEDCKKYRREEEDVAKWIAADKESKGIR